MSLKCSHSLEDHDKIHPVVTGPELARPRSLRYKPLVLWNLPVLTFTLEHSSWKMNYIVTLTI